MRVSKRRFGVQEVRPAVGRTALGGSPSGAVADAADARGRRPAARRHSAATIMILSSSALSVDSSFSPAG